MRIAAHHLDRFPTPQFLQDEERRAVLHVPTRLRVAQIVPAEIFNLRTLHRTLPGFGAHLRHRLTPKAEHICCVSPLCLSTINTMARRSKLLALNLEDVTFMPNGSGTILIRRSKTNREGQGATGYLSRETVR